MNACAEPAHGTRRRYRAGCHCRPCKDAELDYANHRNRLIAYGQWQPYVDAEPVRAHIRTLQAAGLGRRRIAQLAGCSEHTLSNVLYGAHGTPNQRLRTEIAARILAVRPRLEDVHDRVLVDGTGTRRRLRALAALGWTGAALARHLGGDKTQLSLILTREGRTVFAATARSAIRVYDQLWNQDPVRHGVPAWAARRAARDAAARGWAPPGAWDDDTIDDPDALPDLGEQVRRQDALAEDAAFIARTTGADLDQIAARLGVTRNYLDKIRERQTAASAA